MLQTTVCNVGTQLTRWHDHVCERKLPDLASSGMACNRDWHCWNPFSRTVTRTCWG